MAAMDLPAGADVPEWVHLLPAGQAITTFDGRGPYRLTDAAAVIAASMAQPRGMLIDVNHATDLLAPKGGDAPARGWIKELQARDDGIWGRIDWNPSGRALLADRSYKGLSPVIEYFPGGTIARILRASLTNYPNLQHLTALNMESSVTLPTFLARLAEKLGQPATATEEQLLAAIPARTDTALQSQMTAIGTALGVDGGNGTAVLAAVQAMQAAQATTVTQAAQIAALQTAQKQGAADAWMAAQIAAKRGIPADKRPGLIALHMQDAAQAEAVAKLYPDLGPAAATGAAPAAGGASKFATHSDVTAAANDYLAKQKAAGHDITFTQAVQAITEDRA